MDRMKSGRTRSAADLQPVAAFGSKEGVQPGGFKEGVKYTSLSGMSFFKKGGKWHSHSETVDSVRHRELPHDDKSLHAAHGPLYEDPTPIKPHGPKGGKFADGNAHKERQAHLAKLGHHEAAKHLEAAMECHREAAYHLDKGDHASAKDAWKRAREHMTAAKYSHTELGRHHESFRALASSFAAMFKECTRPDCYNMNEGRPEPVTLDKGMKCPKCGTQYPKDWKGHGDERAKDAKFSYEYDAAKESMDPTAHARHLKAGYKYLGNDGHHHWYEHPKTLSRRKEKMYHGPWPRKGEVTLSDKPSGWRLIAPQRQRPSARPVADIQSRFASRMAPAGVDPKHHQALVNHGYEYRGEAPTAKGHHYYEHKSKDGRRASYNANSRTTTVHAAEIRGGTSTHHKAEDLHDYLAQGFDRPHGERGEGKR